MTLNTDTSSDYLRAVASDLSPKRSSPSQILPPNLCNESSIISSGGSGIPQKYPSRRHDCFCKFSQQPKTVLIIMRPNSQYVISWARYLTSLVTRKWDMKVLTEPNVLSELQPFGLPNSISTWGDGAQAADLVSEVDFIIALGGDGTILWVSTLFPECMPPVIGFSMGSLGYLTQFRLGSMLETLGMMASEQFAVALRTRLDVCFKDQDGNVVRKVCALNECAIDRGQSPFLTELNVYWDQEFFTCVCADGLIIATPTGSTAYSMSAGGPMVSPKVPCILFTPICPHSLSFRPLLLPDCVALRIVLAPTSRSSAWVAVDGRAKQELLPGMSLHITSSPFPFPMVQPSTKGLDTWVTSLTKNLYWNRTLRQQASPSMGPADSPNHSRSFARNEESAPRLVAFKDLNENLFQMPPTALGLSAALSASPQKLTRSSSFPAI